MIIWEPGSEGYKRTVLDIQFSSWEESNSFIIKFDELTKSVDTLCEKDLFRYLLIASVDMDIELRQRLEDRIARLI